jgi:ABC-type lipoprotein release transport system permease subunit
LIVLGVLAGVAAGLAIAAVDGAGRAQTAYQRMRAELLGADVVFFPSQVNVGDADITKLGQLPEVAAWAGFASTSGQFDEHPGGGPMVQIGSDWFTQIERAKVLEGRVPDPARDDEAVINAPAARAYGVRVGTVLTWRNLSPADIETAGGFPPANWDWTQATGPLTELHIVGIVRMPMDSVVSFASSPMIWAGPGWAQAHLNESAVDFKNAFVRLRHGAADVAAFEADVARLYGRDDIPVKDLSDDIKRVQRSLDVERTALLLFGLAVVLAAVVLVGLALVRSVRSGSEALPVLRAMGLDRGGLVAGLVVPHVVTIVAAAMTAAITAFLLSSSFPIGLGRKLDPNLGLHVEWPALGIGVVATVVTTAAACGLVAWSTVRRLAGRRRVPHAQLFGVVTRAGAPVPAAVAASLALEAAPARAGTTARPALLAAVIGVLGVVGAVTLVGGIDDALHNPERVGRTWDLEAFDGVGGDDPASLDSVLDAAKDTLAADHDVDAVGLASRAPTVVNGRSDVPLYSVQSLQGAMHFTVLHGRAPEGNDELALGPRTASLIGAGIGDTVVVGPSSQKMKVVGITLLMQTPHTSFDEGAWLTPTVLDAITGTTWEQREGTLFVRLRPGTSVVAASADLAAQGIDAEQPLAPPDVANLGNVRSLPLFLAAFLVLLAVGAVAHALLTGARSRSHDLAVLRALGLTPRQAAACVTWQAAIIGVVALVIGIPLGVVVGRQVWRVLADSLSFVYVGPLTALALLALVPIALAVLGVLAVWPARGAARLRTAEVLRTE